VLLLDNVKSLKFSWDELEALITTSVISGKQNYVGEGRIPNSFTVCMTLNGASLSKDMASRCIVVELTRPTYSGTWAEDTRDFIESNRWAILGDLVAKLRTPAPKLSQHSRWGVWEDLVLARLPRPADTQRIIEERQAEVDDDREEASFVREAIAAALQRRGHYPETQNIFIPSADIRTIVNDATGEKRPVNKSSAYLKTLGIQELRKSDRGHGRGWIWYGPRAATADTVTITPPSPFDCRAT